MPDDNDARPSENTIVAQTVRSWFHKAKDFFINNCGMYDMGDHAQLHISETSRINAGVVFITSVSHASGRRESEGSNQQSGQSLHSEKSVTPGPDNIGSPGEKSPATLAEIPTSVQMNTDAIMSPPDSNDAFKSEVKVDYTDPDVFANSSKACTNHARSYIYSLEMLIHRAGYPLYMPTPSKDLSPAYRKKGIRVGDVGLITENGAFDFLFNTCEHGDPSDAIINPSVLPEGFELLKPIIRISDGFDPGICLQSTHVNGISDHDFMSDESRATIFQCSTKGAVLALPTGATVYGAANGRHFRRHAIRHAANWYRYALNEAGRDITNGSLYLVTECTKSKNWGTAVFYANTTADKNHRAIFNKESCQWEYQGKVHPGVGPKPEDTIILLDDDEPNQCVFLRGFKIMLRPDIWDRFDSEIEVACEDGQSSSHLSTRVTHSSSHGISDNQLGSFHQSTSNNRFESGPNHTQLVLQDVSMNADDTSNDPHAQGLWSRHVILEDLFRGTAPLHPSDPINVMLLLLKPEASVALVHDSVWCDQLPLDFMADPMNPNIDGLLENVKRAYNVIIDEDGSVALTNKDSYLQVQDDSSYGTTPSLTINSPIPSFLSEVAQQNYKHNFISKSPFFTDPFFRAPQTVIDQNIYNKRVEEPSGQHMVIEQDKDKDSFMIDNPAAAFQSPQPPLLANKSEPSNLLQAALKRRKREAKYRCPTCGTNFTASYNLKCLPPC